MQADNPEFAGAITSTSRDLTGQGSATRDTSTDSHGTSVAAVIAGRGAKDAGIVGVAPAASIMSVRIARDADDLDELTLAEGISYAATHGADVINVSVAAERATPQLRAAVRQAQHAGAIVVASAGNAGQQGDPVYYPAALPGVVAVGGSVRGGGPWPQSETGGFVDFAAPALQVRSLSSSGQRSEYAGTTYSAAFVSGVLALLRARFPSESVAQVLNRLSTTAHPLASPVPNDVGGFGVVDPLAALTARAPAPGQRSPLTQAHVRAARKAHDRKPGGAPLAWLVGGSIVLATGLILAGVVGFSRRRRRTS